MRCKEQFARDFGAASRSIKSFPGLWHARIGAQTFATISDVSEDAADTRERQRREVYRKMEPELPDLVSPEASLLLDLNL